MRLPSALDDLRVLDLSQGIAGPFCARLLGDFGADVIKIEPPAGDRGRRMPPFLQDDPDPEKSLFFLLTNLNKRGVVLDLQRQQDVERFRQLARTADVIVENEQPGYLAALGLDYAALAEDNPSLVMTSITPFGQTGPYSRYQGGEIVTYATSGIMAISGTADREPLKHGGFPGQYEGGLNGMLATLVALLARDMTGVGQHVDVSLQEVVASSLVINQPYYSFAGGVQGRRQPSGSSFGQVTPCKDGFFVCQEGGAATWDTIADFFGREALKSERFANLAQRIVNGHELDELILDATKDRTMADMFRTASEQHRILFGIVQTAADLAACPQLEARHYYQLVEHPVIGRIKVPFRPWTMSDSAAECHRPAPLLGQHTAEILSALPQPAVSPRCASAKPDTAAPGTRLPLEGMRIVDISNVFSLPYAAGLLSDLGAEVIKIEGPGRLDVSRQGVFSGVHPDSVPGNDPWNRTSTYNLLNRGKKSLALDLSRPEGREVLTDLIKTSDVLMENFTPRVMRGWKLDYPHVMRLKPDIVMVSCSGYGQNGPYAQYPAQATTQEATHGLVSVTGYRGDVPSKAGQSFVDFLATWALVMGTTLGLRYRHRFGKGLWVDVAMYQLGCTMLSERILEWEANKHLGERIGNRHPWCAPQGCYRCAGDDDWCVVSVRDDTQWTALCGAMGREELAGDPRFASNDARQAHHDEIDTIISAWSATQTKFAMMERLQGAGVPAGAVFDSRDMHLDPHLRTRGFLETVQFPPERGIGKRMIIGRPWQLSKTKLAVRGPAPTLGQHNREVLQGMLGYPETRYAELEAAGIIGTHPTKLRPMTNMDMAERVKQGRLAYWDPDYKQRLGRQE